MDKNKNIAKKRGTWLQTNLSNETPIHVESSLSNYEVNLHSDYDYEIPATPHVPNKELFHKNPTVDCSVAKQSDNRTNSSVVSPSLGFFVNCNDKMPENQCLVKQYNIENGYGHVSPVYTTVTSTYPSPDSPDDCFRFQYVLCAATSLAMKVNEETLTYLNQGQPYELKLKKLGDLASSKGKVFKSVVRVIFHDRRLQYMERERMNSWKASRPGDRLLEIDLPLSYGISDYVVDPSSVNAVQFLWDPTKEVAIYIKVNGVSTEFTARKHGGEKGIAFRLQIETYLHNKDSNVLHSASCQIKVFKLKGADRKHKQDREKIMKKSAIEREDYQQSYDCTVLSDTWPINKTLSSSATINGSLERSSFDKEIEATTGSTIDNLFNSPNKCINFQNISVQESSSLMFPGIVLTKDSTNADVQQWLRTNRFADYCQTFENFAASDMFNLSRSDFIDICGFPDGIRLFNALPLVPRLTLYIETKYSSNTYYPIYLKSLTTKELINSTAPLTGILPSQVNAAFLVGPHNIKIVITDALVENMKDKTLFFAQNITEAVDNNNSDNKLLLKVITIPSNDIPSPSPTQN